MKGQRRAQAKLKNHRLCFHGSGHYKRRRGVRWRKDSTLSQLGLRFIVSLSSNLYLLGTMNTHFNKKRIHKLSSKVNKCSSSAQSSLIPYLLSPGKEPLEFRVGKVLSPGVRFDTLHLLKNLSVALESCICSEGPRLIELSASN